MATDAFRRQSHPRRASAAQASIRVEADPLALLRPRATIVRARRDQQFSLTADQDEVVTIVRSGLLALRTALPGNRRQVLTLLFPRDIFRPSFVPPLPDVSLFAAAASEIWHIPSSTFMALANGDSGLGRALHRQIAEQQSRANLHIAALGNLNGEERVASFLIELTLRFGSVSSDGISFQIPLTRIDIADYLALNADTLSRIMSRLKTRGVVLQKGRGRALVPNGKALRDLSPLADALVSLLGGTSSKRETSTRMLAKT